MVGLLVTGTAFAVTSSQHGSGRPDDETTVADADRRPSSVSDVAATGGVECEYRSADPGTAVPRVVAAPPTRATVSGTVRATLHTNLGEITLSLDASAAPCTVNAFATLAREDFYSDSSCHRLTTDGIWVLQCGDPSGTGTGTPGYSYDDENLPPPNQQPAYPRGTVAMGNSGPGTNGSQFFIVYRDSEMNPDYPVFGRVVDGLDLVDEVAEAGTESGEADGRPKKETRVDEVVIG